MSEKRLIDLDNLLRDLEEQLPMNWTDSDYETDEQFGYEQALNIVKEQPIIDHVKHGKWIEDTVGCGNPFDPYKEDYMDVIKCSKCGTYYGIEGRTNYCPNCGARMDGE